MRTFEFTRGDAKWRYVESDRDVNAQVQRLDGTWYGDRYFVEGREQTGIRALLDRLDRAEKDRDEAMELLKWTSDRLIKSSVTKPRIDAFLAERAKK